MKCKLHLAVYRSAYNTKDDIQRQNEPTTLKKEWPTTNNMPPTITTQRI